MRIPAACTGIFTLRPSFGRFTTQRCRSGLAGQEAVQSVNGPMGKSLQDITMYSKAIVDAEPWKLDPKMLPIPWRSVDVPGRLKIAVLWNDGVCLPTPPVTRALKETTEKLKKAGHEVLDWNPILHGTALTLLVSYFWSYTSPQADKHRDECSSPMAAKASDHYSGRQASHFDLRWFSTKMPKNWAYMTCGSYIQRDPSYNGSTWNSGWRSKGSTPS